MANRWVLLIDNTIWTIYLALSVATPLIFTTFNTELFEIPKMHFVYLGATLILFLTLVKFVLIGKILLPRNIVLLTFAAFVTIQILSTFFSIDKYTSIFGFPTRLNGGLLSQIAYLVIFAGILINLNFEKGKRLLFAIVVGALAVSSWGIPAHFGKDPSCLILTGEWTSNCWKKEFDPTLRIFSTLGQPNWLASYQVLVLPISIAFFLKTKKQNLKLFFLLTSVFIFWALLLTNSRAGALGAGTTIFVFLLLLGLKNIKIFWRPLSLIFAIFIILTLVFGTFLTLRVHEAISSQNQNVNESMTQKNSALTAQKPSQTALATGGTESGQIRLIIWRGAWEIFKYRPILGSGPETFVSSYFIFRPAAHNQNSEWDFFYNKAHNEFLNYLANTGILGFALYIAFLLTALSQLFKSRSDSIMTKAALASIIGYQVTIFFGFSVVATQTTFLLILASAFANQKIKGIRLSFLKENFKPTVIFFISITGVFILTLIFRFYLSNIYEKRAEDFSSADIEKELVAFSQASNILPVDNPYLFASQSTSMALAASALEDSTATLQLLQSADALAQKSLSLSDNNFLIAQRVSKTYILLAQIDDSYNQELEKVCLKLIKLAPTYPPAYLTCAKVQIVLENNQEAIYFTQKALELKPEYIEAKELLGQLTLRSFSE